jgi:hypothetical protein
LNQSPVQVLTKVNRAIVKIVLLWKPGRGKPPVNKDMILVEVVERGEVGEEAVDVPRRTFPFVAKKS